MSFHTKLNSTNQGTYYRLSQCLKMQIEQPRELHSQRADLGYKTKNWGWEVYFSAYL